MTDAWVAIVVAALSLAGTAIGSWTGVRAANRLVNYRLDLLEEKVDKHNKLVEWKYGAEARIRALEEKGQG